MIDELPTSTLITPPCLLTHQNIQGSSSTLPRAYQRVHWVTIEENLDEHVVPLHGKNQYECILKRRAIRKSEDFRGQSNSPNESPSSRSIPAPSSTYKTVPFQSPISKEFQNYLERIGLDPSMDSSSLTYIEEEEIEGDTSLGMKLTILGGKVIVQNIIPLEDGRASPAQLTGLISRGDVLLSVDELSLVGLGNNIERLVDRLKPLSTPMDEQGNFQRFVRLKFDIGQGLSFLEKEEKQQQQYALDMDRPMTTTEGMDGAEDLFNLSKFTFVDQWSGMPLYEDTTTAPQNTRTELNVSDDDEPKDHDVSQDRMEGSMHDYIDTGNDTVRQDRMVLDVRGMISRSVAEETDHLRKTYLSALFTMDDTFSIILRQEVARSSRLIRRSQVHTLQDTLTRMNDSRLMELGDELIHKAQSDFREIEKHLREMIHLDPPIDKRAVWKPYYDRVKYSSLDSVDDYEDIIQLFKHLDEEDMFEFLATNNLWKTQLLKATQSKWLDKDHQEGQSIVTIPLSSHKESLHGGMMTDHLQTLLFGPQENKRKQDDMNMSFPPADLTSLIYTIAKQLSLFLYPLDRVQSEHDLRNLKNRNGVENQITTLQVQGYLFDNLLPSWLHTFIPVKKENRRLIFPIARNIHSKGLSENGVNATASSQSRKLFSTTSKISSIMSEGDVDPTVRHHTCVIQTLVFLYLVIMMLI